MAATNPTGRQIKDGSVQRVDLDVTSVGQSVIAKLITARSIVLTSTGGDAGTGDVTIKDKQLCNAAANSIAIAATDTYLPGSAFTIPAGDLAIGCCYHALIHVSKTAAGTGVPVLVLRIGTLGTISDAAIYTGTLVAGTAAADTGLMEMWVYFSNVGSAAQAQVVVNLAHNTANAGLWGTVPAELIGTLTSPATFNSTAVTKIGCSYKGDVGNHVVSVLKAELLYP